MSGFNLRSKNNAIHDSVEKNTPRHELKVAMPDNACKKPQSLHVATNIWKNLIIATHSTVAMQNTRTLNNCRTDYGAE